MDTLRTIVLSPGGRPIQRVQLADPAGLTVYTERSSFNIVPAAKTQNWSRSARRYAGSTQTGESSDNWTMNASWWIKGGGNPNQVLANAEALLAEVDDVQGLTPTQPKYIEWRPDGAAQSTLFEIRGTGIYTPHYDWAAFAGAQMLKLDMGWPIASLAEGLPLDVTDPFDVDSRADYTVDVGPALTFGANTITTIYGSLSPASLASTLQLRHTARGLQYGDVQVAAGFTVATPVPTELSAIASAIDGNNYLYARLSGGTLQILKDDVGSVTSLASVSGPTITAGHSYWLRLREEGNMVYAEAWADTPPTPLGTPTAAISVALAGADATKYGLGAVGTAGLRATNAGTDLKITYFEALPYTYVNHLLPGNIGLPAVPGTAPPRFDLLVTTGGKPLDPNGMHFSAQSPGGSGGTFPATGNYIYGVTAVSPSGETPISIPESNVTITATTQTVTMTWNPVPDAIAYNIYRTAAGGGVGTEKLIATVSGQTLTFTDTGLANGTILAPVTNGAYLTTPQWGLVAWSRAPSNYNRIWNGDFETDVDGWTSGNTAPANVGGWSNFTSMTRGTVQPDVGAGHGIIAMPASTTQAAAKFAIARRFHAGRTYTVTARLASPTLTDSARLEFVAATQPGLTHPWSVVGTLVALTTAYQTYTATITATVDVDWAVLGIVRLGGGGVAAGNIYVDQVQCYEGTVAPTVLSQRQGAGAYPPLGILDAAASKPGDIVANNCTVTYGNSPSLPYNTQPSSLLIAATAGTAGSALADWWIDPHLMATPDDFARGTIAIEVYWRGCCPPAAPNGSGQNYVQNPRIVISAICDPLRGIVQERFTQEFGTTGRTLAQSSVSSTVAPTARMSRLGTIVLPVNPANPVRWKLKATHLWSAANTTVASAVTGLATDYLMVLPARRRACGPTGKSRTDGTYPTWHNNAITPSVQARKTIRSSLRGRVALPVALPVNDIEDTGLSGIPLEMQAPPPPGAAGGGLTQDQMLFVKLSSLVPDDPTAEAGELVVYPAAVHVAVTPRYRLARGQ